MKAGALCESLIAVLTLGGLSKDRAEGVLMGLEFAHFEPGMAHRITADFAARAQPKMDTRAEWQNVRELVESYAAEVADQTQGANK